MPVLRYTQLPRSSATLQVASSCSGKRSGRRRPGYGRRQPPMPGLRARSSGPAAVALIVRMHTQLGVPLGEGSRTCRGRDWGIMVHASGPRPSAAPHHSSGDAASNTRSWGTRTGLTPSVFGRTAISQPLPWPAVVTVLRLLVATSPRSLPQRLVPSTGDCRGRPASSRRSCG